MSQQLTISIPVQAFLVPIYEVLRSFACAQSLRQDLHRLKEAKIRAIVLQASLTPSDLLSLGAIIADQDWSDLPWGAPRLLSLASVNKDTASRILSFAHTASDPLPQLAKACLTEANLLAKPGWKPPQARPKVQIGSGQAWVSPSEWGVAPRKAPSSTPSPLQNSLSPRTTPVYQIGNVGNIQRTDTRRSQSSLGSDDTGSKTCVNCNNDACTADVIIIRCSASSKDKLMKASKDALLGAPAAKYARTGRGLIRVG